MKKTMITLALFLFTSMGMMAQQLEGAWHALIHQDDQVADLILAFETSKVDMKVSLTIEEEQFGSMDLSVVVPGNYTREGKNLTINIDAKKAKVEFGEIRYSEETKKLMESNPNLAIVFDQLKESIKTGLEEQKEGLLESMPGQGTLTIEELTDTTLTLADPDDGESVTFTRWE